MNLPVPTTDVPNDAPGYQGGAEFFVDRNRIPGLPGMLERAAGKADQCRSFFQENTYLTGGEGWINHISGAHENVVATTQRWLNEIDDPVMSGTASGIRTAMNAFLYTDDDTAAQLDATVAGTEISLGPVPQDPLDPGGNIVNDFAVFDDVYDATAGHAEIEGKDYAKDLTWEPVYHDYVGMASIGRSAIIEVTGFLADIGWFWDDKAWDPYEWCIKPVVGDWAGLARCGDVLHSVGKGVWELGYNIDRSRHMLSPIWRGRSADTCVAFLGEVTKSLMDAKPELSAMGDEYAKASKAAQDFRDVVASLINGLVDAAIVLSLAIAAGGAAAAPTAGGSVVVGGIVGAFEIMSVWSKTKDVVDNYKLCEDIVKIAGSAMGDFGQLNATSFDLPKPPNVGPDGKLAQLPG